MMFRENPAEMDKMEIEDPVVAAPGATAALDMAVPIEMATKGLMEMMAKARALSKLPLDLFQGLTEKK
jgi:hypothetical protein